MARSNPSENASKTKKSKSNNKIKKPIAARDNETNTSQSKSESDEPKNYERVIAEWTRVVGVFTVVLAVATGVSSYFLWKTDATLHNTMVASERAWLGPTNFEFIKAIDVPEGPVIMGHYRNVGKFPALDVKIGMGWIITPLKDVYDGSGFPDPILTWEIIDKTLRTACEANQPIIGGDIVFPSEHLERNGIATPPNYIVEKAEIEAKRQAIIVTGCFTYRTFEKPHHTGFCRFATKGRTGAWEFLTCPKANFAD